eukprot:XP_019919295.1 PREDICTED: uncharacterized protein LOC109617515 [Crassostrea gigas]
MPTAVNRKPVTRLQARTQLTVTEPSTVDPIQEQEQQPASDIEDSDSEVTLRLPEPTFEQSSPVNQPTATPARQSGNMFILVLFYLWLTITVTEADQGVNRINYGVIFEQQGKITPIQNWKHTFYLPLPNLIVQGKPDNNITNPQFAKSVNTIYDIHLDSLKRIATSISNIKQLLPEHGAPKPSRRKRSFLPFFGELSKTLFGTATVDDVNNLKRSIQRIQRQNNLMTTTFEHQMEHFSSFLTSADQRLNNAFEAVGTNHQEIQLLHQQFNSSIIEVEQMQFLLTSLLSRQLRDSANLEERLNRFYFGVLSLFQNSISPSLIPVAILQNVINNVQELLIASNSQFYLVEKHVDFYYSKATFYFFRHGETIFITLNFPISSFSKPMKLFKVLSFPFPINNSSHASQLLNLPSHFAISHDNSLFTTLTQDHINSANFFHHHYLLSESLIYKSISQPNCVSSVYLDDRQTIQDKCNFRLLLDQNFTGIRPLNDSHILLYNVSKLSLQCKSSYKELPGCSFCIINIPCHCRVNSSSQTFIRGSHACHSSPLNLTAIYPVNLALLQNYFSFNDLKTITANSTFPKPVNATLPQFKIFDHKFSSLVANDQKLHLNLQKAIELTKKDQIIFKQLSDTTLDDNLFPETVLTNQMIISITALVLSTLLLFSLRIPLL